MNRPANWRDNYGSVNLHLNFLRVMQRVRERALQGRPNNGVQAILLEFDRQIHIDAYIAQAAGRAYEIGRYPNLQILAIELARRAVFGNVKAYARAKRRQKELRRRHGHVASTIGFRLIDDDHMLARIGSKRNSAKLLNSDFHGFTS
jgi:hypothetical protein